MTVAISLKMFSGFESNRLVSIVGSYRRIAPEIKGPKNRTSSEWRSMYDCRTKGGVRT